MGKQPPQYDEASFWRKVRRFAFRAGRNVIEKALILYFCLRDPRTPRWAKGIIISALVYFILPLDAVPDILPGVGFTDDLGVLVAVLTTILAHVRPEHRERAKELLEWKWAARAGQSRAEEQSRQKRGAGRSRQAASPRTRYSAVLGVEPDADLLEIRSQYLDLVKKYHPDRVQHLGPEFQEMAEQKLKEINEAYAFFSSPGS